MLIKSNDLEHNVVENFLGGKGTADKKLLLREAGLHGNGRTFAIITLKKGSSTGYHKHTGEFEAMYILEGEGIHNDNGNIYPVKEGDLTITEDGESHSLENTGETELKFIALVLNSNK